MAFLALAPGGLRAAPKSPCEFPAALSVETRRLFPGYSVVSARDLRKGDRVRFRSDHGNACPGLAPLDFYGSENPTVALALFRRVAGKLEVKLIVATRPGRAAGPWKLDEVDTATLTAAPVIWAEPPQDLRDVHDGKVLHARHPALLFVQYESWAIAYAWTGSQVEKAWVAD